MMKDYLQTYNFNLPLEDAINDPALSVTRRMLAGAAMPQALDDAYLSAMELFEAFEQLCADRRARISDGCGTLMIQEILAADCDDYQRRIYYIVSELDVYEALGDLIWLVQVTKGRARMVRAIREAGASMPLLPGRVGETGDPMLPR